jgi:hypothetical protein
VTPWTTEEPVVESLGLRDVITRLSSIPYRVTTAEDSREAEVIHQAVDAASTGCLLNIKTGRVTATATYRLTFTDASPSTDYSVDKLAAGAWANVGTGTRSTTFTSSDDFTISPDCFAGTFSQGDTFTFCVYARLPQLERQGNYAKVEVASSTAETKWGRTEATVDNPFLPRAQTIDFLTRVLTWQSVPHRRFTVGVPPWFYAAELEARTLVSAGTTYGGILIGWRRQIGKSARKQLTLVEA